MSDDCINRGGLRYLNDLLTMSLTIRTPTAAGRKGGTMAFFKSIIDANSNARGEADQTGGWDR